VKSHYLLPAQWSNRQRRHQRSQFIQDNDQLSFLLEIIVHISWPTQTFQDSLKLTLCIRTLITCLLQIHKRLFGLP